MADRSDRFHAGLAVLAVAPDPCAWAISACIVAARCKREGGEGGEGYKLLARVSAPRKACGRLTRPLVSTVGAMTGAGRPAPSRPLRPSLPSLCCCARSAQRYMPWRDPPPKRSKREAAVAGAGAATAGAGVGGVGMTSMWAAASARSARSASSHERTCWKREPEVQMEVDSGVAPAVATALGASAIGPTYATEPSFMCSRWVGQWSRPSKMCVE
mmetsp:Transcript_39907/g.68487  ORF Transcript_39907/g.68487 Transcript_39907/m.68487 type:complete len:215 (+) Transcript_39907:281-925(+)